MDFEDVNTALYRLRPALGLLSSKKYALVRSWHAGRRRPGYSFHPRSAARLVPPPGPWVHRASGRGSQR
jgi:hypothetical protein